MPSHWAFKIYEGPLSKSSLMRAHCGAPELLSILDSELHSYWRHQALNLAVGGAVPLLGYLWLGWSGPLIALSLILHLIASGVGDRLKLHLAGRQVMEELGRTWEIEHLDAVERAMTRPRLSRGPPSASPHRLRRPRWVYKGVDIEQDPFESCHSFITKAQETVATPVFVMTFALIHSVRHEIDPTAALLLVLGMLAEVTRAGFFARRARDTEEVGPELLPNGMLTCAVLFTAFALMLPLMEMIEMLDPILPEGVVHVWETNPLGLLIPVSYLLSCLALVIGSQFRNRHRLQALTRFAYQDREQLLQQWCRLNGDMARAAC